MNSIWELLQAKKERNGRISFHKTGLKIYGVIFLIILICTFIIGHNVEIKNPFNKTSENVEKLQATIEDNLAADIAKINKSLSDSEKLEERATYSTAGSIMDYEYYQYIAYTSSYNAYVVWIVDSKTGDILSVWTAEQHAEGGDSIAQKILENILDETYKDKITDEQRSEIKEHYKETEDATFNDEDFGYVQQFDKKNVSEGFDYICLYELDFFTYTPDNVVTNTDDTEEADKSTDTDTTEGKDSKDTTKNEK